MRHHFSVWVSLCVWTHGDWLLGTRQPAHSGYFSVTLHTQWCPQHTWKHYCPGRWWTKGSTHHRTGASPQSDLADLLTHTHTQTREHMMLSNVQKLHNEYIIQLHHTDIIYVPHELIDSHFNGINVSLKHTSTSNSSMKAQMEFLCTKSTFLPF